VSKLFSFFSRYILLEYWINCGSIACVSAYRWGRGGGLKISLKLALGFKLAARKNVLSQTSHLNGFSSVCNLLCVFKFPAREKVLSHSSHLNGFFPVCTLWCWFKCCIREYILWHTSYLHVFFSSWVFFTSFQFSILFPLQATFQTSFLIFQSFSFRFRCTRVWETTCRWILCNN
jgi:hypothetical protein